MNEVIKICKKHGELNETQVVKEKNKYVKAGYQLRCHQCRLDKDRGYKLRNPDKHKASAGRARSEARRLYREGLTDIEPKANVWKREDRKKNSEKYLIKENEYRKKQGQLRNTKEVCRRFNIDVSLYYEMLSKQNNVCAICGKQEIRRSRTEGKIRALAIDHCHKTNKIRELLCSNCNNGLGSFLDDIEIMKKAIAYLKKHNT